MLHRILLRSAPTILLLGCGFVPTVTGVLVVHQINGRDPAANPAFAHGGASATAAVGQPLSIGPAEPRVPG